MIFHLIRHELRLIAREPRFWVPFLLPPLFLVSMQFYLASRYPGGIDLGPSNLLTIGALLSTLSVTLTADSFAGERERNTLELLLCLPISLGQLFAAKLLALLPLPLILAALSQFLFWWSMPQASPVLLWVAWGFSAGSCLVITGLALVVSLHSSSVRSAAQGTLIFVLLLLFAVQWVAPWYFTHPILPWAWPMGAGLLFVGACVLGLRRFGHPMGGR